MGLVQGDGQPRGSRRPGWGRHVQWCWLHTTQPRGAARVTRPLESHAMAAWLNSCYRKLHVLPSSPVSSNGRTLLCSY